MKRIDQEFAFQTRELAAQIEDILGDPPNHKNFRQFADALLQEFSKGTFIEDVNLLSFTLVDHLEFNDPAGLLASAKKYDTTHPANIIPMASCKETAYAEMLAKVAGTHPALARRAIIVAFLHKNRKLWLNEESAPPEEDEDEDKDDNYSDDDNVPTSDMIDLFDPKGDENGG